MSDRRPWQDNLKSACIKQDGYQRAARGRLLQTVDCTEHAGQARSRPARSVHQVEWGLSMTAESRGIDDRAGRLMLAQNLRSDLLAQINL